jgi:hypothetical protein
MQVHEIWAKFHRRPQEKYDFHYTDFLQNTPFLSGIRFRSLPNFTQARKKKKNLASMRRNSFTP